MNEKQFRDNLELRKNEIKEETNKKVLELTGKTTIELVEDIIKERIADYKGNDSFNTIDIINLYDNTPEYQEVSGKEFRAMRKLAGKKDNNHFSFNNMHYSKNVGTCKNPIDYAKREYKISIVLSESYDSCSIDWSGEHIVSIPNIVILDIINELKSSGYDAYSHTIEYGGWSQSHVVMSIRVNKDHKYNWEIQNEEQLKYEKIQIMHDKTEKLNLKKLELQVNNMKENS